MEKCAHVSKIRPAWDHSILNPEKWLCFTCHTTESVWACLSCSNVACGRFNEQHALKHFQDSKHPISIEVNDKYVYCYVCDDYVLNDNASGDIKLLRSALSAIATQKFTDIESRGRRLLRSYSHSGVIQREHADEDDKIVTAEWHQRQRLLGKIFGAWRTYVYNQKLLKERSSKTKKEKKKLEAAPSISLKKRTIIPGVTGLRNLGNTCYMNSVLQVLSHIDAFRDFFLSLKNYFDQSPSLSPQVSSLMKSLSTNKSSVTSSPKDSTSKLIIRQTTMECFQHLMSTRSKAQNASSQRQMGGLNGGSAPSTSRRRQLICEVEAKGTADKNVSLCSELLGLFRVLWSGKWAQVSPHAFLQAVWQAIPLFKGYAQHDAQEFLCELLDKVQTELDCVPKPLRPEDSQLVTELFQGELVSQVTCQACRKLSQTYELFLDLSLEFPDRYQITKQNSRVAQDVCHVTEMLAKFTEVEDLEGQIYACENCNSKKGQQKETVYTEARKRLLIYKLPQILRLHLKRFRWSGRYHREKISTHVAFDENLDLKPFCCEDSTQTCHEYQLFAVIIHHGKGFGSGHYTAFTWNSEAESWVNCNDSRMRLSGTEEVLMSQAYILFYRAVTDKLPLLTKFSSSDLSVCSMNSTDTLPYNLKSDGTFILEGEEDCSWKNLLSSSPPSLRKEYIKEEETKPSVSPKMCLDISDTVNSFVEIDNEISFKESPNTSFVSCQDTSAFDTKATKKEIRGQKRSLKSSEDSFTSPGKRKKKMSFTTEMFYPQKLEPRFEGQDMTDSAFNSAQQKLDKNAHTPFKAQPKSQGHIKRRKSAFW